MTKLSKGQPGHELLGLGCSGGAGPYLDVWYPEEANVEHAVGHEAGQIQDDEVEAQTNNTVGGEIDRTDEPASEGMGEEEKELPVHKKEGLAPASRALA